ncbi:MAG: hypothetical protein ABSD46_09350 [Bacteroidota bacterium]
MKISIDLKFLATAIISLAIIIASITLLNYLFGPTVASVVGTILGVVALRAFDKLDYTPTVKLQTPAYNSDLFLSIVISIFIMLGLLRLLDASVDYAKLIYGSNYYCNWAPFILLVIFDWCLYIIAGILIGRIYPERALLLTGIACFITILVTIPAIYTSQTTDNVKKFMDCLFGVKYEKGDDSASGGVKIGQMIGLVIRIYLAILFARISSKASKKKDQ